MNDAFGLTETLGGKWYRSYGVAPCPVCQPKRNKGQNALTLSDGTNGLLAHCKKSNCAFLEILAALGVRAGAYTPPDAATLAGREAEQKAETAKRALQAKKLWSETQPIGGTLAETYLRARGITCPLPSALRFHASCWHGPTAKQIPALVAAVQGAGLPAIHRTYLRADGSGKADLDATKLMLGATAGGAVRLTESRGSLVVTEGIETALSLACGLLRAPATIWAALSTSGVRSLRLPRDAGRLIIASDGDTAGRAAANVLAERAQAEGWQVSLLDAPDGRDWNDVLIKNEAEQ